MRCYRKFSVAITAALLMLSVAANAQDMTVKAFKGNWNGPTRQILPGPGPMPGQNLSDYFANLKTGPRIPAPVHILVLGGSTGFHHDSISTAMAAVLRWGRETGAWDAELRTDFDLVTDQGGGPMNAGFQPAGLRDFDAVIIANAEGDWGLRPEQKAALLAFVRDRGKGLVVIHAGLAANRDWRDYIEMIGGEQTGHPFNTLERVVRPFALINEDPDFPATSHLPRRFVKQDELYVVRNWLRSEVDVLLRLDERSLDFTGIEDQVPPDHDMPIAWSKTFGSGRVFASSLGHTRESYDDPEIARMYSEAIRWVLKLSDGGIGPESRTQPTRTAVKNNPAR